MNETHTLTLDQIVDAAIDKAMSPPRSKRWTLGEMLTLARSGVHKVDLMGPRGTTLCTMDEIEAMAGALVLAGILQPTTKETSE